MKSSTVRILTATGVFVVVGIGLAFHTGFGTPSSFGWDSIAAVCPLGVFETFLAGRTFAPAALICLAVAVILILVLGRVFCGWLCPIPLLRRLFGGKKAVSRDVSDTGDVPESRRLATNPGISGEDERDTKTENTPSSPLSDAEIALLEVPCPMGGSDCHSCEATHRRKRHPLRLKTSRLDSRHAVLAGALASTAVLGFPVFCLVCPVGLVFATFIGLWRLIQFNETTWMLVVFPIILVLELVVLRKWCHRFCPLGAVISLVAKGNRTFRPTIDESKCLQQTRGITCNACYSACPEGIDLHDPYNSVPLGECTKCRMCVDACPAGAITMPFLPKHGGGVRDGVTDASGG